jgi:hypothetical protein
MSKHCAGLRSAPLYQHRKEEKLIADLDRNRHKPQETPVEVFDRCHDGAIRLRPQETRNGEIIRPGEIIHPGTHFLLLTTWHEDTAAQAARILVAEADLRPHRSLSPISRNSPLVAAIQRMHEAEPSRQGG